jgi:hypothetical protein
MDIACGVCGGDSARRQISLRELQKFLFHPPIHLLFHSYVSLQVGCASEQISHHHHTGSVSAGNLCVCVCVCGGGGGVRGARERFGPNQ